MTDAVIAAVIAAVVALTVVLFFRSMAREQVRAAEAEAKRVRAVLEDVKDVAWSNRDIAPDLSTIIIETIRSSERDYRPELNS